MPRSWLVTGARGQLGRDLVHLLEQRPGDEVLGLGRAELDLTDEQQVRTTVRGWLDRAQEQGRQAVCLNAGAYTAVDAAETDELTARRVNGDAPGWLAEELAGRGRLVHVSTDYVFDGTATRPYPVGWSSTVVRISHMSRLRAIPPETVMRVIFWPASSCSRTPWAIK